MSDDIAKTAATQTHVNDMAAQIIEETVRRCQALHEYAGRPAWEQVIRDVIQKHLVAMLAMERRDKWEKIETAPKDRTPVIIAVPTKDRDDYIVGEAYFDPEHYGDGDWWWAGNSHGDYHDGPISDINYHGPTHWQHLPTAPEGGEQP